MLLLLLTGSIEGTHLQWLIIAHNHIIIVVDDIIIELSSSSPGSNLIFLYIAAFSPLPAPVSSGCCSNLRFICSAFRLCTSMCFTKWSLRMNPFPQASQWKGLLPLCRHMCLRRSVLWLNALGQSSHLKGLSPTCFATWSSWDWPQEKRLPHRWHLNGFSPLWNVLLCCVR